MSGQKVCMVMRVNLDCPCCKKMRRIILRMKEIEMHLIEKQEKRISIMGRLDPADTAIRIRKKMNRRVDILDIQLPQQPDPDPDQMHQQPT
ncbi:heavy metal-associated isoprenylated plant protein 2-like [Solanum pennellii]|uniref:Heavy metal-associated isoprenylated plant protein 2-like n=1 Tax=Solanum pennellii TaxID=28526 RepID=A0ABM1VAG3_SOLPN|nr:heavy metal-associated isoprenylated plant protein 2-like [Solanum pennellii]